MKNDKQIMPTSTALEARLRIFQPSQKRVYKEINIKTDWGTAVVNGRLGQRHADVLEAIRACALQTKKIEDGLIFLVDMYEVRKKIGGEGYYSYEQVQKLLKDLTEALVTIETKDIKAMGHFIDYVEESKKTIMDKRGRERYLMIVKMGAVGLKLLNEDFKLYYDPAPIAKLKFGISQAIARFVLTHKTVPKGGWKIDTLINAVSGDVSNKTLRNYRSRINEDVEKLKKCGITVENNRVFKNIGVPQAPKCVPQAPKCVPQAPKCVPQAPK